MGAGLVVCAAWLVGCRSAPDPGAHGVARAYPEGLARAGTLDIQVVRSGTRMTMTNTTARSLGAGTVWLNMQWSRPIPGFASGETLTLELSEFLNEYGERFRAGGFFASERPDSIALTQVETTDAAGGRALIGLVTVVGTAE